MSDASRSKPDCFFLINPDEEGGIMSYNVDTVIFDFDGVIADTGADIAAAANYVLDSLGIPPLPEKTVVSYIGGGAGPLVKKILGPQGEDKELFEASLSLFKERYDRHCAELTTLYPGVMDVLKKLHSAGKTLAIATQKTESQTDTIIRHLGIDHFFAVVVGPDSITRKKPDPESMFLILDRTGGKPDASIMIGDKASDILAGKAAGMPTCGATYGFGSREELEEAGADFFIETASELLEYIV
jgi:phosphoglycolate phosphatase